MASVTLKSMADLASRSSLALTDLIAVAASNDPTLNSVSLSLLKSLISGDNTLAISTIAATLKALNANFANSQAALAAYEARLGLKLPRFYPEQGTGDDAAAIQAAVTAAEEAGDKGGVVDLGNYTWRPLSTITVNPVRCSILGDTAFIDVRNRTFTAPGSELALDPSFTDESLWSIRDDQTGPGWVFDAAGGITAAPTSDTSADNFCVMYQTTPIALEAGQVYLMSCTVDSITNVADQKYVYVSVRTDGTSTSKLISTAYRNIAASGTVSWQFEATATQSGYLTIQTSNDASVSAISIRNIGDNVVLKVRTPATADGGETHGHHFRPWGDFKIYGAGDAYSIGIKLSTLVDGFSSRLNLYNVDMENINTCVLFAERAYLTSFFDCRLRATSTTGKSVHLLSGMPDAGENLNCHGGNLGGGGWGIHNEMGADINLFGTSIDFADRFLEGTGTHSFIGCHLEKHPVSGDPDCYPVTIYGESSFTMVGGKIMISGGGAVAAEDRPTYVFYMPEKGAWVRGIAVDCYSLTSASGAMAGPDGRIDWNAIGGSSKELAPIAHDGFRNSLAGQGGQFEISTSLVQANVDAYVYGGTITDRNTAAYGTLGLSTSVFHGGAQSLVFTKTAASASYPKARILVPFPANRIAGYSFWWAVQNAAKSSATADFNVYCDIYYAAVRGRDSLGNPILGDVEFVSELALEVPYDTGVVDWTQQAANFGRWDASLTRDGWAPAFTTHLMFDFNLYAFPSGGQFFLDDLIVTPL